MSYRLTETAAKKLEQEIRYSKRKWGLSHAKKYKHDLMTLVKKIALTPKLYPEKPEIGEGIRCVRFKGNYIVYEINEQENSILILNFPSIYDEDIL